MKRGNQNFWQKLHAEKLPFFVLAPMADVTDWPFRQIVAQCGRPEVFFTEFVSADGLASEKGREKLLPFLHFTEDERPIVAQVFGSRPENILKTAQLARELGFDGLDINMGCPDRKVVKQGAGIGLCKTPQLAQEVIFAAKEGFSGPVSVKTRLGLNSVEIDSWIPTLLETGISALTIHGRTMKEMSKVPAHWNLIGEVARMAKEKGVIVIGNGDVSSKQEGIEKAQQYGLDGIMVGRGIFQNPWLFSLKEVELPSGRDRLQLLVRHTELFEQFWKGRRNFDVLKRFYKVYVSDFDGAKELRAELMKIKSAEEVFAILNK